MNTYRIIESRPATMYWEYIIDAENETDALSMVLEGEVEPEESYTEEDESEESDYEISTAD